MRTLLVRVLRSLAVVAVAVPLASAAAELKVRKPKAAEVGQQVTCPVMNMEFKVGDDTPTVDYKGKAYHFCCDHCISDFKKNPEKFAKATAAAIEVRKASEAELGKAAKCAVTGTEFAVRADTPVVDYQGKSYYFCCEHCVSDFQAKPEKYALR